MGCQEEFTFIVDIRYSALISITPSKCLQQQKPIGGSTSGILHLVTLFSGLDFNFQENDKKIKQVQKKFLWILTGS